MHLLHGSSGSVGSKAQGGQPGSGVYGSSVAPVVSQSSSSFSHSASATTTAPYSTDTSTDYSQYSQAYPQVLQHNTHPLHTRNAELGCWMCACECYGVQTVGEMDGCWIDRCMMSAAVTEWAVTRGGREVEEMRMGMDIWTDRMREDLAESAVCLHLSLSLPLS